ncbi:MAG: NFACT family protein [Spirochaetia bacterium]
MSLNWREIDLILSELPLEGSHIQKIRQPDYKTLLLELYRQKRRFNLLISLRQGCTRLHEASLPVKNLVPLQRFAQLLRSRIQGGKISEAVQIKGERIIRFTILRGGETTYLFARLWGGASNIIACNEDHTILDTFYRRPNKNEYSGAHYDPEEQISASGGSQSTDSERFQVRPYPKERSFNSYIEEVYRKKELEEERERLKRSAEAKISKERNKIESTIEKLERSVEESEESKGYKEAADLIMSNLHRIRGGTKWVEVENFYRNNEKTEIELDPALSPQKNAEAYYERYSRTKRAAEKVKDELENKKQELERLKERERQLLEAPDLETEVEGLRHFVETQKQEKPKGGDEVMPGLRFQSGPFTILVGRNSRENDALLRRYVRGNDYWLHTRDFPGGFVFIRSISGKSIPLETLLDAGNLALYFSKGKSDGKAELYYTQVKYLRRAKEGKEGLVLPTQEKNMTVLLDEERIRRLFNR